MEKYLLIRTQYVDAKERHVEQGMFLHFGYDFLKVIEANGRESAMKMAEELLNSDLSYLEMGLGEKEESLPESYGRDAKLYTKIELVKEGEAEMQSYVFC